AFLRATAWIPHRAGREWRCRGNRASRPWPAPAPRAGCRHRSARRHRRRASRFHGPWRLPLFFLPSLRAKRSNPDRFRGCSLDCFVASLIAMTLIIVRLFWYGRLNMSSTSLPAGQPLAFHAPDQEVDAVLAEKRFVLEHEGRHAPMAGRRVV